MPHWHHDQRWEMLPWQQDLHVRVRWSVKEMDSLYFPHCGWDRGLEGARMGKYKYKKALRNREWWRSFSFCGAHRETAALVEQYVFFFSHMRTCSISLFLLNESERAWLTSWIQEQSTPRAIRACFHDPIASKISNDARLFLYLFPLLFIYSWFSFLHAFELGCCGQEQTHCASALGVVNGLSIGLEFIHGWVCGGGAGSLSSLFRPSLTLYFTLSNIYFSRSASHTGKVNPNGLLIILGRKDSVPPCN